MNKLISLELRRNSLRPYHVATLISAVSLLMLLYLFALIPKLDQAETGVDLFTSYHSLIELINIIGVAVFSMLSSVMSAKFIIEEYMGKRAILLFSYPIARRSILFSKIAMVFFYTTAAMFLCSIIVCGTFFTTEAMVPLCEDELCVRTIIYSLFSLLCHSLLAGILGVISLWIGFEKRSVTVTIVASVIIAIVFCQLMAVTMTSLVSLAFFLVGSGIIAVIAVKNLAWKVENMEV